MLLARLLGATGQVTRWIKQQFGPEGVLTRIYSDLLWRT
ncbi:LysR family transcriptional regulator, partial [Klebsiella pneumoniae]